MLSIRFGQRRRFTGFGYVHRRNGGGTTASGFTQYGIFAFNYGKGSNTVVTGFGSTRNSGGGGINVGNQASSIAVGGGSTVTVVSQGSITSGANNNLPGSAPAAILAGYNPSGSNAFNANVNGNVVGDVAGDGVTNGKIVAGAGDGISTYNYGVGNVTVNLGFGVSIQALTSANVASGGAPYGIGASNYGPGNIIVATSSPDSIVSGSSGINAVNLSTATANSIIAVTTEGSIQSGNDPSQNGT